MVTAKKIEVAYDSPEDRFESGVFLRPFVK